VDTVSNIGPTSGLMMTSILVIRLHNLKVQLTISNLPIESFEAAAGGREISLLNRPSMLCSSESIFQNAPKKPLQIIYPLNQDPLFQTPILSSKSLIHELMSQLNSQERRSISRHRSGKSRSESREERLEPPVPVKPADYPSNRRLAFHGL
jgi:hypothetical protein